MRGRDAAQLLDDPTLKEAFAAIETHYIQAWRNSPSDDRGWEIRAEAYDILRAMDVFKAQLTSFVIDGKLAETKLNRRED